MRTGRTTISSLRVRAAEAMRERRRQMEVPDDAPLHQLRLAERRVSRYEGLKHSAKMLRGEDCAVTPYDEGRYYIASVDTMEFMVTGSVFIPQVRLLGTCPECGGRTPSVMVYNLEGLGELLEEFTPDYSHTHSYLREPPHVPPGAQSAACAVEESENGAAKGDGATAERLTEALDEFIRERLASVGDTAGEQTDDNSPSVDKAPARRQRKS